MGEKANRPIWLWGTVLTVLPSTKTLSPPLTSVLPRVLSRGVAFRGRMTVDGYQPENHEWLDHLTVPGERVGSDGQPRPAGRDPMVIPVEVLTAAGHPPRSTKVLINAIKSLRGGRSEDGDVVDPGIRRHKHIRSHCLECAADKTEVRYCAVIDCPFWPYRMGRNPHNPRRGINPFAAATCSSACRVRAQSQAPIPAQAAQSATSDSPCYRMAELRYLNRA